MKKSTTIVFVLREVARECDIPVGQLTSRDRQRRRATRARAVAASVLRALGYTYTEIGRIFHRHHSTVLVQLRSKADPVIVKRVLEVLGRLGVVPLRPAPPPRAALPSVRVTRILVGDQFTAPIAPEFGQGFVRATAEEAGYYIETSSLPVCFVADRTLREADKAREVGG